MDQIVESITPNSVYGDLTSFEKRRCSESNAMQRASIEVMGCNLQNISRKEYPHGDLFTTCASVEMTTGRRAASREVGLGV